ncbi:MAG: YdcF family protein [Pseudomonadota bacterium]|nr:YdcF family protein [Pseudomonadota bacterium]
MSKIFWFIFDPGNIFVFVLVFVSVMLWLGKHNLVKWSMLVFMFFVLLVSIFPIGGKLLVILENRFPRVDKVPENIKGIIVLGGVVNQFVSADRGVASVGGSVERIIYFCKLAKEYPDTKLVFTGGSGNLLDQRLKEAKFVAPLMIQLGLDPSRVIFESKSRNTWENAVYSKNAIKPSDDELWLLITSAFHAPRSVGAFRKAGWNVMAYPVDYNTLSTAGHQLGFNFRGGINSLAFSAREWIGLTAYWLTGRSSQLFPSR